jgi:hypothetical protein
VQSPPDGVVNVVYDSHTLTAQGGDGTYTWSLVSTSVNCSGTGITRRCSSLPAGLSLSRDGVITGTPTEAGTWIFGVEVSASGWQSGRGT